jgi:hypothetical protein
MKKVTVTPRVFKGIVRRRWEGELNVWSARLDYSCKAGIYLHCKHQFTEAHYRRTTKRQLQKKRTDMKRSKTKSERAH